MMLRDRAQELLNVLTEAMEKKLSPGVSNFYLKKFIERDEKLMEQAINNALDEAKKFFPRWGTLKAHYDALARVEADRYVRRQRQRESETPMTPAELQDAAEQMATAAAERRSRHGGRLDIFSRLLEQGAEVYAANAARRAQGRSLLPVPRIGAVIPALAQTLRRDDAA